MGGQQCVYWMIRNYRTVITGQQILSAVNNSRISRIVTQTYRPCGPGNACTLLRWLETVATSALYFCEGSYQIVLVGACVCVYVWVCVTVNKRITQKVARGFHEKVFFFWGKM